MAHLNIVLIRKEILAKRETEILYRVTRTNANKEDIPVLSTQLICLMELLH